MLVEKSLIDEIVLGDAKLKLFAILAALFLLASMTPVRGVDQSALNKTFAPTVPDIALSTPESLDINAVTATYLETCLVLYDEEMPSLAYAVNSIGGWVMYRQAIESIVQRANSIWARNWDT